MFDILKIYFRVVGLLWDYIKKDFKIILKFNVRVFGKMDLYFNLLSFEVVENLFIWKCEVVLIMKG